MAKYTLLLCLILFTSGCMTNLEDISTNEIPPTFVSFSEDIQSIFNSSCSGSGCHIPNTTNGVNLSSYSSAMNSIGLAYGTAVIKPGDAENSPLVDKIQPNPENGVRMPQTGGYLTPTEINLIIAWIDAGAENN